MSISGALSNALSGLTASARATEVVSANIANVMTDGYGRRQLDLSSRSVGGNGTGVWIDGVSRLVDPVILGDRRLADAALGDSATRAKFLHKIETAIGSPEDAGSLSARLATLESSLIQASSRPDSATRLGNVLNAAQSVVSHINTASDSIQAIRMEADQTISSQVNQVNDALSRIEKLNTDIVSQRGSGHDTNGLLDQRQKLIDGISSIIPLRQVPRENGRIALFTPGGAVLLDGPAAKLGFSSVGTIVPQMTLASGALSGLTLNGRTLDTSGTYSPIRGGSLAALFQTRDEITVSAQQDLDAFSRDLIERFQDPSVDPTLAVGAAGLFTDGGTAFNSANEMALSSRLSINTLVNPDTGGALWRLRDGIGATAPGDVGNARLLQGLTTALTGARVPASGSFIGAARSLSGLGADLVSILSTQRQSVESQSAFSSARVNSLKTQELKNGVDTDQEMQHLLLVEQAYAANARVIKTAGDLIQTLLRI